MRFHAGNFIAKFITLQVSTRLMQKHHVQYPEMFLLSPRPFVTTGVRIQGIAPTEHGFCAYPCARSHPSEHYSAILKGCAFVCN
jgi:hypothetical protein